MRQSLDFLSRLPLFEYPCGNPGCPSIHDVEDHHLHFWRLNSGEVGIKCMACEKEWQSLNLFYDFHRDGLKPTIGILLPFAAIAFVWFLSWPLALKIVMAILSLLSLFKPLSIIFKQRKKQELLSLLSSFAFPKNQAPKEALEKKTEQIDDMFLEPGFARLVPGVRPMLKHLVEETIPQVTFLQYFSTRLLVLRELPEVGEERKDLENYTSLLRSIFSKRVVVEELAERIQSVESNLEFLLTKLLAELQDISFLLEHEDSEEEDGLEQILEKVKVEIVETQEIFEAIFRKSPG